MTKQASFSANVVSLACLLAVSATACSVAAQQQLPVATPASQGIDGAVLQRMVAHVASEEYPMRSMIVVRNGHVVLEWYADGITRNDTHNVYSVSKSVVGTLAGIAIDQQRLQVDDTLTELFPESASLKQASPKGSVKLEHLLTMQSGFPVARANKPTGIERDLFRGMHRSANRVDHVLQMELIATPGMTFRYNNTDPQLVLGAIANVVDGSMEDWARESLFEPLGFENHRWIGVDSTKLPPGGYGLQLRAIDMAKLGQLNLQRGTWADRQLVSRDYIDMATSNRTGTGYGYYWWFSKVAGRYQAYSAKGLYGQMILVVPELKLVFVTTAKLPSNKVRSTLRTLVEDYVVASLDSIDDTN